MAIVANAKVGKTFSSYRVRIPYRNQILFSNLHNSIRHIARSLEIKYTQYPVTYKGWVKGCYVYNTFLTMNKKQYFL